MITETRAIVIKKVKVSGADVLLTIYSRELGKKKVYVKGARHPKSGFLSASQVLIEGDFTLYLRSSLSSINSVYITDSHNSIRENLNKFFIASYMLELIDKFTQESNADGALYDFLSFSLKCLEAETDKNLKFFRLIYTIKMLQRAGLSPEINFCTSCLSSEDLNFFSSSSGGAICSKCKRNFADTMILERQNRDFINKSLNEVYVNMRKYFNENYNLDELSNMLESFLNQHVLSSSIKSFSIIKDMGL